MSQTIAMLVHSIFDSPSRWRDSDPGFISDGYYRLETNCRSYGMGTAVYQATATECEMLKKAFDSWKEETGWTPPEPKKAEQPLHEKVAIRQTPDVFLRREYEAFAYSIRQHFRSFSVHNDASVFKAKIQESLSKLDDAIRPIEMIEGKKRNNEGGQEGSISGA